MPNPVAGDVHVNRPLTQISIAYMQKAEGFVASTVFPNMPVQKQSDRYFQYDRTDFWRNQMAKRAPSTETAGSGWKIDSTPTYYCHVYGLHKDIDDQIRANVDEPLDLDRDATLWLGQQALVAREVLWTAAYFTTGIWKGIDGTATDVTGVSGTPSTNQVKQWNDAASTPVEDVTVYADTMHQLTGYRPNTLVMGRQVWSKLKNHPELIDRIKFGSSNSEPTIVSKAAVAALFELERILIMDGIQTTSPEVATFETAKTTAFIAGKKALLMYVAPSPSLLAPSAGYTFSWAGYMGAGGLGQRVKRMRADLINSDRVEIEMAFDLKVVAADCGVFLNSIVA